MKQFAPLVENLELLLVGAVCSLAVAEVVRRFWRRSLFDASQRRFTADTKLDLFFGFLTSVSQFLLGLFTPFWLAYVLQDGHVRQVHAALSNLHFGGQLVTYYLLLELRSYWQHRLSHLVFWRFHLVHHAVNEMDWSASLRFHPAELLLGLPFRLLLIAIIRPAPLVPLIVGVIIGIHALLGHFNVRWTYGPLKYIISSPIYHRWHHERGLGKAVNFCETFPLVDWVFGTYYQPSDRAPQQCGVEETTPTSCLAMFSYPFRRGAGRGGAVVPPRALEQARFVRRPAEEIADPD